MFFKKRIFIVLFLMVALAGLGMYSLKLMFGTDVRCPYGSYAYWLNVDHTVKNFPIFGAKRSDVTCWTSPQDGTAAESTKLVYKTSNNIESVLTNYENALLNMGFDVLPANRMSDAQLGFTGKGYSVIYIMIEPNESSNSEVMIDFVKEFGH